MELLWQKITEWLKQVDPNYHYEDSVDFDLYNRIIFQ